MAESSIGSASLFLGANFGNLNTGLNQASGAIAGWATRINGSVSLLATGPFGLLAGVAVSVGRAVINSFSNIAEQIDATSKQAATLGIPVATLQGLQHAAGLAGVSSEDLNKSLVKMSRTVNDALGGNNTAQRAFDSLGISMDQLQGKDPGQVFDMVADRVAAIEDPMQRVGVLTEIFGRQGAQLAPLFAQGAAGIAAARAEAEALGLTTTDEQAQGIEAMNDAMSRVGLGIQGMFQQIVVALAPTIEAIATGITSVITAVMPVVRFVGEALSNVMSLVGPLISEGFALIGGWISSAVEWLGSWGISWDTVKAIILGVLQGIATGLSYVWDILKIGSGFLMTYLIVPLGRGFQFLMRIVEGALNVASRLPGVGRAFRGAAEGVRNFRNNVQTAVDNMAETGERLRNTNLSDGAQQVDQFFERVRDRSNQARQEAARPTAIDTMRQALIGDIRKLQEELDKEFDQFGMSSIEKKIADLLAKGATEADVRPLRERLDRNLAQQLTFDADPTQGLTKRMDELDRLLESGAISWDVYSHHANEALKKAESSLGLGGEVKTPTAVFQGSAAATEAVIRHNLQGAVDQDPQARLQRVMEEQRRIQERALIAQETMVAIMLEQAAADDEEGVI